LAQAILAQAILAQAFWLKFVSVVLKQI